MCQVRVSAVLSNAPFLLNLDCDHYLYNSRAVREAMCFLMDPQIGKKLCYVQFPQRFDGIDRHDRYANRNVVFFDVSCKLNTKIFLHFDNLIFHYNHLYLPDQHERPRWHPRACIRWDGVCL